MTIDRMDSRVDVMRSPTGGGGSSSSTGSSSSPTPTPPVGGGDSSMEALRPLVMQIVNDDLLNRLKIAGVR